MKTRSLQTMYVYIEDTDLQQPHYQHCAILGQFLITASEYISFFHLQFTLGLFLVHVLRHSAGCVFDIELSKTA